MFDFVEVMTLVWSDWLGGWRLGDCHLGLCIVDSKTVISVCKFLPERSDGVEAVSTGQTC